MNILMLFAFTEKPASPGWYIRRSFLRMGHSITTMGHNCEINTKGNNPYQTKNIHNIIKKKNIDLVLEIDSGGFDISWNPGHLKAQYKNVKFIYWGSDTHLGTVAGVYGNKRKRYDIAFFAQKKFIDDQHMSHRYWLPHACDPEFHNPDIEDKKKVHDVTFIGHKHPTVHGKRIALLKMIKNDRIDINDRCYIYTKKMGAQFVKSRIVLNCSLNGDLNMRFFEAMCSGACLLTDWSDHGGFAEQGFKRGEHYCAYDSNRHAVTAIRALLNDHEKRKRIAKAGQKYVLENHTYDDRARKILSFVE